MVRHKGVCRGSRDEGRVRGTESLSYASELLLYSPRTVLRVLIVFRSVSLTSRWGVYGVCAAYLKFSFYNPPACRCFPFPSVKFFPPFGILCMNPSRAAS